MSGYIPRTRYTRGPGCGEIDHKELLKEQLQQQNTRDPDFRFSTLPPPSSADFGKNIGFQDVELYFDSSNRDAISDYANGEVQWQISPLNNNNDLKNCIEFHLNQFYFPKILGPAGSPDPFYFRRVYVEITSAPSTQAVQCLNGAHFHFEFDVQNINGQCVLLVPIKPSFFLQRPLQSLAELQMRFMTPPSAGWQGSFNRIPIPRDTVPVVSLTSGGFGYNPIRFQITSGDLTTALLGPVGSLGSPGVAVFLTGYNSNDTATNTAVNNTAGLYATTVIDATTFEIASINGSAVTGGYGATLCIPKNRFAFPMRFTCVQDRPTNYIAVNHI